MQFLAISWSVIGLVAGTSDRAGQTVRYSERVGYFEMSGNSPDTPDLDQQNGLKREAWSELDYNLVEANLQDFNSEHYSYSFPSMPSALDAFEKNVFEENSEVILKRIK